MIWHTSMDKNEQFIQLHWRWYLLLLSSLALKCDILLTVDLTNYSRWYMLFINFDRSMLVLFVLFYICWFFTWFFVLAGWSVLLSVRLGYLGYFYYFVFAGYFVVAVVISIVVSVFLIIVLVVLGYFMHRCCQMSIIIIIS